MKGYLSIREISYKWGVSERRVNQYVTEGRIPGVERFFASHFLSLSIVKSSTFIISLKNGSFSEDLPASLHSPV